MNRSIWIILCVLALCSVVQARPLSIILVTSSNSSEDGYAAFLQDLYLDNAGVEIDSKRYTEPLSENKKQQLLGADLIIVSSDNPGGDYNADSAFWATAPVPILSHNVALCRSNSHANWDWFGSDRTTAAISAFYATAPGDALFAGIDLSAGSIALFDAAMVFPVPDQPYSGYGTPLAVDSRGLPVVVRFDGTEPNYYDGSLYGPNQSRRMYFAMPQKPATFFAQATPAGKQLLRNAITSLLPECWLPGDIDCDRDVDMQDLSALAGQWLGESLPESELSAADIVPDGSVDMDDLTLLATHWLEGFDTTAPLPDPSDWTDVPAIQDGGFVRMKAKNTTDELHGVQYLFECLDNPLYSSGWRYGREYIPAGLPTGTTLSFWVKARDTSGRFNETRSSSIRTVRTDGLFYRIADASAAVALDGERFIVADDEDNVLRVYDWTEPASEPIRQTSVSEAIGVDTAHPEADIEGATWFNERVFWITSHGRSQYGDYWPSRYRFFATSIAPDGSATVDGVYSGLIDALIPYDITWNLGLGAAIGTTGGHIDAGTIAELAPKVNGLNIEGLCTSADGSTMFIGFRNPRPVIDGKIMALVIPLANPEAVVLSGATPILEAPLLIDLNDLGIRSMDYSSSLGKYLIVAGSHRGSENAPVQYLYQYDFAQAKKDKLATFSDITPEAMFQFSGSGDIHLLSDDGTRLIDTPAGPVINKELPRSQRTYRTRTLMP